MNDDLLEAVRAANREFEGFMDEVALKGATVTASRGVARRLEKVNRRLKEVSNHLAPGPGRSKPHVPAEHELLKYQENLKRLRSALESLQFSLLAEKTRLENVGANLHSARAWAASLRDIS